LQRTFKYASLLRISGALHLGIFDQPEKNEFFNRLKRHDPGDISTVEEALAGALIRERT